MKLLSCIINNHKQVHTLSDTFSYVFNCLIFLFDVRFVRRLMYFYKPSSKLYANLDLDYAKSKQLTVVGCQFTEFLLESEEVKSIYFFSHK